MLTVAAVTGLLHFVFLAAPLVFSAALRFLVSAAFLAAADRSAFGRAAAISY